MRTTEDGSRAAGDDARAAVAPVRGGLGLTPASRRGAPGFALALQRAAGNRATRRVLARTPRDDGIRAFRAHVAAREWQEAALRLNGFDERDIRALTGALTHDQRIAVHQAALEAMPGWPTRVPAIILEVDAEAGRVGQVFADFERERRAGNWRAAARIANGFAEGDLHARLAPLTADQLRSLRAGAVAEMPGWSDRVTDAIDVLLDDVRRPLVTAVEQRFANPRIQAMVSANRLGFGPRRLAALHVLDRPLGGRWTQLRWPDVAASAAARVEDPSRVDQSLLGVCGPAAALQANADANALDYAELIANIFATGTVRGAAVNAGLLGAAPYQNMDPADWMALSAIQDTGNLIRDYPGHPTDHAPDGTPRSVPFHRRGGYDPEGGFGYNQRAIMARVDGCVDFRELDCAWWGERAAAREASELLRRFPRDVVVSVANDSSMLMGTPEGTGAPGHRDHWVRLLEPVAYAGGNVTFSIFSWGRRMTFTWPEARFHRWAYGFLVGARRAGLVNPVETPVGD
jgi:hypothetical protein